VREELIALLQPGKRAFLVGIGGIGMSGLARIMKERGMAVSGSDAKRSRIIDKLEAEGIPVEIGHRGNFEHAPDFVAFSSAIHESNPDLVAARAMGVPLFHRAEVLAQIINRAISIAVTGTHGKTTCSALASFLLCEAGLRPSCIVGGEILNYHSNVVIGNPHFYVAEIDESDRSHLHFSPDIALITSLEAEHLDHYGSLDDLKEAFRSFIRQMETTGQVVYCLDGRHIREVMSTSQLRSVSYGLSPGADFCVTEVAFQGFSSSYTLHERGKRIDTVEIRMPGLHNIVNSLGVIAVLRSFGLGYERILPRMASFRGVGRRLEVKLDRPELLVVDDYAHHPSEVKAGLSAIGGLRKRMTAVFQPHRFSRTEFLANEFSHVFADAERVLLTEIYGAGEKNVGEIGVNLIYDAVKKSGHQDVQIVRRDRVIDYLCSRMGEEETVAFMGAGDIGEVADEFAGRFESSYSH